SAFALGPNHPTRQSPCRLWSSFVRNIVEAARLVGASARQSPRRPEGSSPHNQRPGHCTAVLLAEWRVRSAGGAESAPPQNAPTGASGGCLLGGTRVSGTRGGAGASRVSDRLVSVTGENSGTEVDHPCR